MRPRTAQRSASLTAGDAQSADRGVGGAELVGGELEQHRVGPGRRVNAVGHRRDRNIVGLEAGPQRAEHSARHLAVQPGDAVGPLRQTQPHDRHVELRRIAARVLLLTERDDVGCRDPGQQVGREVLRDHVDLEPVDARRHRGVGGEHGSGAHDLQGRGERQTGADEVAHPFESLESGVTLVGVEHRGARRSGELRVDLDGAHPADAEQQLLQQSVLASAAVQSVGDAAQGILVLGNVGVEQQQADATHRDLPDPRVERAVVGQREHDVRGAAIRVAQHRQRQAVRVEHGIALELPALARDRLSKVAGAIEETDAD